MYRYTAARGRINRAKAGVEADIRPSVYTARVELMKSYVGLAP